MALGSHAGLAIALFGEAVSAASVRLAAARRLIVIAAARSIVVVVVVIFN